METQGMIDKDKRHQELVADFHKYIEEVEAIHPDCDHRKVFEAWAIQMIGNLQVMVETLAGEPGHEP